MPLDESLITSVSGGEADGRFNYQCGHCGRNVSGRVVSIYPKNDRINPLIRFMICPSCVKGSIWSKDNIILPGAKPGKNLEGIPNDINAAYQEARGCFSIGAFTGCELLCRKILMHVGVDKGAQEGKSFASYLDFLEGEGYITPPIKEWADMIRQIGNLSTHKLDPPDKVRAEATLMFTMELLRIIYEMKYMATKFKKNP